jgi:hypothetical protein
VPDVNWVALALLMGSVLFVALYGLAASGHFPADFRGEALQRGWGLFVLWGTLFTSGLAAAAALSLAWRALPWYAIVIGSGVALLFAPLVLQSLPDTFVNGRRGLLVLALCSVAFATLLWGAT